MTTVPAMYAARFLFHTDVYKLGHVQLYPKGIQRVFSNYTNRSSRIPDIDKVVHFGLRGFTLDLMAEYFEFIDGNIDEIVEYYAKTVTNILGVEPATEHIRELHAYGQTNRSPYGTPIFPVAFYTLPEGTEVPLRVPSFVFTNTDERFAWLVNYIETWMSAAIWHPSTVATKALHFRRLLDKYALETTGSTEGVGFQGHDFSYRGLEGNEAAGAAGAAHLLVFDGSDNLQSLVYLTDHYGVQPTEDFVLGSVMASEHSVMCAGTAIDGEFETYKRILEENPTGIISLVSDTYDLWKVITDFLPRLKDVIEGRDGKLVIRPDSGNPVDIIPGTVPFGKVVKGRTLPEHKGVIELLWDIFGGTVNEQGYKVLSDKIGAIYGDSITYERAEEIMDRLKAKGFATTNIVFGVGSYQYQYNTRDTFGSAVKATAAIIDDEQYPMFKDPITDDGTKKSAKGWLKVTEGLKLIDNLTEREFFDSVETGENLLQPINADEDFVTIRARVRKAL